MTLRGRRLRGTPRQELLLVRTGASHVHELLAQAGEYGYCALALTDANLCGALEFARLAVSLGIKPITGGELTLTDGSRIALLAKTREATPTSPACSRWPTLKTAGNPNWTPRTCPNTPEVWRCSPGDAAGLSPGWSGKAA